MLEKPEDAYDHMRRFATAVILASVYGIRAEDELVERVFEVQERFAGMLAPGAAPPIDAFAFLKWMPDFLAGWRIKAKAVGREHRELYKKVFEKTKIRTKAGGPDCMLGRLLREREKGGRDMSDEEMIYAGTPMVEAGSETTSSTLQTWIIAMTENPDIFLKIQKELDSVCGNEIPGPKHTDQLPYLRAVMLETLRWRPAIPLGVPHRLTKDDVYEGYFLPKGTIVFANTWSLSCDEEQVEEPYRFRPERYLNNEYGIRPELVGEDVTSQRRQTYAFGAGRRLCVGQKYAENSLVLVMAKIAWAFNIAADPEHPIDSTVEGGYVDGLSLLPKPFRVRASVRSGTREATVRAAFKKTDAFLRRYEDRDAA